MVDGVVNNMLCPRGRRPKDDIDKVCEGDILWEGLGEDIGLRDGGGG